MWILAIILSSFLLLVKGEEHRGEYLEHLGYKYGSDKSKDDHGYLTVYANLFASKRHSIFNITEIGVNMGQSLQIWHEYFPKATIYGIDIKIEPFVRTGFVNATRIKLFQCDSLVYAQVSQIGMTENSMDLIIDDGLHYRDTQEIVLSHFWRYLKPGGMYIIEDVDAQKGGMDFKEFPEKLKSFTAEIFRDNHVMFVDTAIGHRNWDHFKSVSGPHWVVDRKIHNCYLVVIRKRQGTVPPVNTHSGSRSMKREGLQIVAHDPNTTSF